MVIGDGVLIRAELEINARPLAQASVKTVGRVQFTEHLLDLASTIIIMSRIYYYSK